MILYLWDDVSNLSKITHLRFFENRYSFNLDDCQKYELRYLPMFTQLTERGHAQTNEFDIAIIGSAHPDRLTACEKIYEKYKDKYKFFIYLHQNPVKNNFYCFEKALSYKQYIDILKMSRAVLDIPFINQKGPTTRSVDALLTSTKVITTNAEIKRYPFFSENILIIDRENPIIPEQFLEKPYIENKLISPSTVEEWLDMLLLMPNKN